MGVAAENVQVLSVIGECHASNLAEDVNDPLGPMPWARPAAV